MEAKKEIREEIKGGILSVVFVLIAVSFFYYMSYTIPVITTDGYGHIYEGDKPLLDGAFDLSLTVELLVFIGYLGFHTVVSLAVSTFFICIIAFVFNIEYEKISALKFLEVLLND